MAVVLTRKTNLPLPSRRSFRITARLTLHTGLSAVRCETAVSFCALFTDQRADYRCIRLECFCTGSTPFESRSVSLPVILTRFIPLFFPCKLITGYHLIFCHICSLTPGTYSTCIQS